MLGIKPKMIPRLVWQSPRYFRFWGVYLLWQGYRIRLLP